MVRDPKLPTVWHRKHAQHLVCLLHGGLGGEGGALDPAGRLAFGTDLLNELTRICTDQDIRLGRVEAIGAVQSARIGFYNQQAREYEFLSFDYPLEILKLAGNVSLREGKPMVHAHITLGLPDFTVLGGHLVEGTISVTGEIWIHGAPLDVTRRPGDFPGLKLIRFPD